MSKNSLEIITLKKPNVKDFAKERNDLLSKSKADWVFFLDSDESLSPDLKEEMYKVIKEDNFRGFYVYRKNYFCGQYVGTDKILRLAKRDGGKWQRAVHETWNIKGELGQLKNPLIHVTSKTVFEMVSKLNSYSSLHAKANKSQGKKSNLFKIIFFPKIKFVQSVFKGRGLVFSILQSFHSYLAWSKEWLLSK